MCKDGLAEMNRQATEEHEAAHLSAGYYKIYVIHSQEWNPQDVLDQRGEESLMAQSILKDRVREVAADGEHKADTHPDFETS